MSVNANCMHGPAAEPFDRMSIELTAAHLPVLPWHDVGVGVGEMAGG